MELAAKASKNSRAIADLCRSVDQARKQQRREATALTGHIHKLTTRLGPEAVEQIVAEYLSGQTTRTLATRYGISKTAVLHAIRSAGHEPRPRGPRPQSAS